jgi:hypothetical protein
MFFGFKIKFVCDDCDDVCGDLKKKKMYFILNVEIGLLYYLYLN